MCFFRKKISDSRKKDRELIAKMEGIIDIMITKSIDDAKVVEALNVVKNNVHYLVPSGEKKVISADEKLLSQIDDVKLDFLKDKYDQERAIAAVKELNVAVSIRNSKLN